MISEAEKDIIKEAIDFYINQLEKADTKEDFEIEQIKRKVEQLKSVRYKYFIEREV